MRTLLVSVLVAVAAMLWLAAAQADPVIPQPSTKQFYCYRFGSHMPFPCWCDEWLRYPVCKRWHWDPR